MSCSLRAPTLRDYEEIASWIPDAAACLHWAGPGVVFPFVAAELPRLLAVRGESYCLAGSAGAPYGFGQYRLGEPAAVHLCRIIVAPAMRGRGYGRELCTLLSARAVEATGAAAVTLNVYPSNTVAIALYRSVGFVAVEPQPRPETILMRRSAS